MSKKKVVVAMSGGLDSSAIAFLLQKHEFEVMGVFMRLGIIGEQNHEAAARRVCQKLNIKFYPINFAQRFRKEVVDYFLDSYDNGLTPNPCVKCNQVIKFGELLKRVKELGADYLATGHYVRNAKCKMQNAKLIYKLFRGEDRDKDQSYFLYNLTQARLARVLFPLGNLTKTEVKKMADKAKLPYLTRESQDVCFLKGDHNDFLKEHLDFKPGKIKTLNNKTVGRHQGLPLYTIGQRKGVEIGGIGPFYAVKCDYKTNTLYVVTDREDSALYSNELIAENVNWIAGVEPKMPLQCEAVIRYRHKPVKCKVIKLKVKSYKVKNFNRCGYLVKFDKPQRAVTPGQSAVFYRFKRRVANTAHANYNNGDEVLGGGVIA